MTWLKKIKVRRYIKKYSLIDFVEVVGVASMLDNKIVNEEVLRSNTLFVEYIDEKIKMSLDERKLLIEWFRERYSIFIHDCKDSLFLKKVKSKVFLRLANRDKNKGFVEIVKKIVDSDAVITSEEEDFLSHLKEL